MGAVPLTPTNFSQGNFDLRRDSRPSPDWMRLGTAGTLLTGAILLLTGNRRAGMVVSAAGAALAMVEEKELVRQAWEALPGYLDTTQRILDQAQEIINDLSSKHDKIMSILGKQRGGN